MEALLLLDVQKASQTANAAVIASQKAMHAAVMAEAIAKSLMAVSAKPATGKALLLLDALQKASLSAKAAVIASLKAADDAAMAVAIGKSLMVVSANKPATGGRRRKYLWSPDKDDVFDDAIEKCGGLFVAPLKLRDELEKQYAERGWSIDFKRNDVKNRVKTLKAACKRIKAKDEAEGDV